MADADTLDDIITRFGRAAKAKLNNPAVSGAPEDQLRGPLEALFSDLAAVCGLAPGAVALVGETTLRDLKTRPDYAVTLLNGLVGFIEVKAPGKGADPRKFKDPHDVDQWKKLQSLPNLIYTDGNGFSLWRNGALEGEIVALDGDVEQSGAALRAPASLPALFADFVSWTPSVPKNASELALVAARLCRLLRDEAAERLAGGSEALTDLAEDWRRYLFPSASNETFADGYAQAVTFGLLMARARGIELSGGLDRVATELRKSNSLIGTALRLLTDDAENRETLKTSLQTLTRVLDAVHWPAVSKGDPDAWLYFYESFLAVYDNALRKKTGSYYTPPEVVQSMIRLVDEALKSETRFALADGLASPDVTVVDPAMGTGTFLLGVVRRIARTVAADQGPGAVAGAIDAAMFRLIGFELQFGPYAVAQLRLDAEIRSLRDDLRGGDAPAPDLRLFVTDTLGNPFVETEQLPTILRALSESRRKANEIKRRVPITAVIGNPPYREKAKGMGAWIESGVEDVKGSAPLAAWFAPKDWGVGAHLKHLRNLYVYFWRWATWKVFGDGEQDAAALGRSRNRRGVVCLITASGFLNGPGFQKMRADLRRDADEIWVIDCTPEGHRPPSETCLFQGVQQQVCIVMAIRNTDAGRDGPARVRYRALPKERREGKFVALSGIGLDDGGWRECRDAPRASFYPAGEGDWETFPALEDLFVYHGSGVMPGRTWVIAPDRGSLERRWERLRDEPDAAKKSRLFHPHPQGDKDVGRTPTRGLYGRGFRKMAVANDAGPVVAPMRYAFRSFDRQWIVPDNRLLNRPNPTLWERHSDGQVYLTAPSREPPSSGPAATLAADIPDLDHYRGRGGRVFPLWADAKATASNIRPAPVTALAARLGLAVSPEDFFAYVAAVLVNPAFTRRFAGDLLQPGLRVPITADAALFGEAVAIGAEVVWLHTGGERFVDAGRNRPKGPPRMARGTGPTIPKAGAIPTDAERFPDEMSYDAGARRLHVGAGHIDNIPQAVWDYEVSGMKALTQWFSYRKRDRSRPIVGNRRPPSPLGDIQPEGWLADYTTDLVNMLHVLGRLAGLEPDQARLLERICAGPTVAADELRDGGAPEDAPGGGRGGRADARQDDLI